MVRETTSYPMSRRKATTARVAFSKFCSTNARHIVTIATLPPAVREMLEESQEECRYLSQQEGYNLLTHHEYPEVIKTGQLLLWPLDEKLPESPAQKFNNPLTNFKNRLNVSVDKRRRKLARLTPKQTKARLGQFMTPTRIANYLASLFDKQAESEAVLLDPGAGIGSLSDSFLSCHATKFKHISVTACEIDSKLVVELSKTLTGVNADIIQADFIETAVNWLQFEPNRRFTHVIMNPPYRKIATNSAARKLLRHVDIETVNLYSAFVALAIKLLKPNGQLVAIIPRSFCNGTYYRPFRELIFKECSISHIHLFDSRKSAFKDDNVLQENIVLKLIKGMPQETVDISVSEDDSFTDYRIETYPFSRIVRSCNTERFINIPTNKEQDLLCSLAKATYSLDELGINVSTGPVVAFRVRDFLAQAPIEGSIPLLLPVHCRGYHSIWPQTDSKKPNALIANTETERLFYPIGHYCVVRRFSAKEEQRRVRACTVLPQSFPEYSVLSFENHLNVFHESKIGLAEEIAQGLTAYLNTTLVDNYFRCFNGHTQVNATDLRQLRYPSRKALLQIGVWAKSQHHLTQENIDSYVSKLLS